MNSSTSSSTHAGLRVWLPGFLLLAAVLWFMRDTAVAMVNIWWRSETFTHAFLVPPIAIWLAWRRRDRLAGVALRPMPWMLVPIVAVCLLWTLGELAAVAAASQFALVALIILSVPAVFGWAVTRELLFPLGFLLFAVPLGEFLVPTMINYTADFTVWALRVTGIPVYREGNDFVIPSGNWSVVEACSGVRYLIASLMVGTLFAYLNYRSLTRRLLFVGVAILVPIVANWLRAYMIVMVGHLSGNRLAVGVDHLVYGWVFFGVVIGLMFWIGARWAEPDADIPQAAPSGVTGGAEASSAWRVAVAAVALLVATMLWLQQIDKRLALAAAPALAQPGELAQGWASDAAVDLGWQPAWNEPDARYSGGYRKGDDAVWVWAGYFRHQDTDKKLVASTNTLAGGSDSVWVETESSTRKVTIGGSELAIRASELRQATSLTGGAPKRLQVLQVYWIDGRFTASAAEAKLLQAWAALRGRGDDGAVLLMAVPKNEHADEVLHQFASQQLPAFGEHFAAVRDAR